MHRYRKLTRFPYTAEQLFELVLDVESYPEFVPGWRSVTIRRRDGNALSVEQTLSLGPLRWQFASQATFERPTRITIESSATPFRRLLLEWCFKPEHDGCVVQLEVVAAFRTQHLERLSKTMTPLLTDGIIAAFARRATERLQPPRR